VTIAIGIATRATASGSLTYRLDVQQQRRPRILMFRHCDGASSQAASRPAVAPPSTHNATYLPSASIEVAAVHVASCRRLDHVTVCASADSWPMIRGVPLGRRFGPLAPHPFDPSWL